MKYEICIICGQTNCQANDFCVSGEFYVVCENCYDEYRKELEEKAKDASEIEELPFYPPC